MNHQALTRKTAPPQFRRWIKNQIRAWTKDLRSLLWHGQTWFGPVRVWRIAHRYDKSSTPACFVQGRGNPENILGYLQFLAERKITIHCSLTNEGAAQMLARFYGYRLMSSPRKKPFSSICTGYERTAAGMGCITDWLSCSIGGLACSENSKAVWKCEKTGTFKGDPFKLHPLRS